MLISVWIFMEGFVEFDNKGITTIVLPRNIISAQSIARCLINSEL